MQHEKLAIENYEKFFKEQAFSMLFAVFNDDR